MPHYLQMHLGRPEHDMTHATLEIQQKAAQARMDLNRIYEQVEPTGWLENDFRNLAGTMTDIADELGKVGQAVQGAQDPVVYEATDRMGTVLAALTQLLNNPKVKKDLAWVDVSGKGATAMIQDLVVVVREGFVALREFANPDMKSEIDRVLNSPEYQLPHVA